MRYLRVLIGLALTPLAWHLHKQAIALDDLAREPLYTLDNPCPKGRENHFFRRPATEAVQEPQNQARQAEARSTERFAGGCLLAAALLVLSAFVPRRPPPAGPSLVPADGPEPDPNVTEHAKEGEPCNSAASS